MQNMTQFSKQPGISAAIGAALVLALVADAAAAAEPPIAGLEPSMRPAGAPVITDYPKDANWYRWALTGIVPPYPAGLRFLEDQGAWHTPFVRPGMTGPYDIRHWHRPGSTGAGQAAEKR
jgi:hypothetical protein